jgi:hypothetical protein
MRQPTYPEIAGMSKCLTLERTKAGRLEFVHPQTSAFADYGSQWKQGNNINQIYSIDTLD